MVCRTTKLLTEHSPCQMCFLRQQRQQDYCFQLVNCALFLEDNRDNRNNKKNGRNCGMSRGDIQLGQQDYCCQLVFLVNCRVFSDDNNDNGNNGRNGRMSRGDIQPTHS